jgi:hypothetical protein
LKEIEFDDNYPILVIGDVVIRPVIVLRLFFVFCFFFFFCVDIISSSITDPLLLRRRGEPNDPMNDDLVVY